MKSLLNNEAQAKIDKYRLPRVVNVFFFGIMIALFINVVISEGGFSSKPFAVCNGPPGSYCKNPLINSSYCLNHLSESFCNIETFTGEIGIKPGKTYNNFGGQIAFILGCYAFAFFGNMGYIKGMEKRRVKK
jgi:hypothetical protein